MAGKGDKYRPYNKEVFDRNYDEIFGKNKIILSKLNIKCPSCASDDIDQADDKKFKCNKCFKEFEA